MTRRLPAPFTLADFDFALPRELIAQHPAAERSASRLLDGTRPTPRATAASATCPTLLRAGDLLVVNDTRVIKARLFGVKASGGAVEVLVERVEAGRRRASRSCARARRRRPGSIDPLRRCASTPRCSAAPGSDGVAVPPALPGRAARRCSSATATCRCRPTSTRADDGRRRRALPDRVRRAPGRGRRADRGAALRRRAARRARRARRRARRGHAARRRRHLPAGARREPRRAPRCTASATRSAPATVAAIARGARARRPRRRGRHDQPARARIGGAAQRAARARAGARRDRPLHHAGLRVPRRRPAAHQLPPAEEHAADAGRARSPAASASARSTRHAIARALPLLQLRRRDAARARAPCRRIATIR